MFPIAVPRKMQDLIAGRIDYLCPIAAGAILAVIEQGMASVSI
jgi:hypothetical protein